MHFLRILDHFQKAITFESISYIFLLFGLIGVGVPRLRNSKGKRHEHFPDPNTGATHDNTSLPNPTVS